jgi:hypothetical protein
MNENDLEIEKLKIKIQNLECEKKIGQIREGYEKDRFMCNDKICIGLGIGATMGIPISIISCSFSMEPAIGIIVDIIMCALTGMFIVGLTGGCG